LAKVQILNTLKLSLIKKHLFSQFLKKIKMAKNMHVCVCVFFGLRVVIFLFLELKLPEFSIGF